jgi:predicted DNA-binding transcriptional regulator YafY
MNGNKGFFLNDEQKLHINLSSLTWSIIGQDLFHFGGDFRLSTLLNLIIRNFHQSAQASIGRRLHEYEKKLRALADTMSKDLDTYIQSLLDFERNRLQSRIQPDKGASTKLRLTNENAKLMSESIEAHHYDYNPSAYVKAILEEYARQSLIERESVIKKDVIDAIELALEAHRKLKITIAKSSFVVIPYAIKASKENAFRYLISLDEKGSIFTNRISRIKAVSYLHRRRITNDERETIEEHLIRSGPQFVGDEIEEIKVKLTPMGVKSYRLSFYNKPQYIRVDPDNTFVFHCTRKQILAYFFRFGHNAKIIEPIDLQSRFKELYELAYSAYQT